MASYENTGPFYRAIEKKLYEHLHVNDLSIIQRMTNGFSGAEVYQINLNCPQFTGSYFLKIEQSKERQQPELGDVPFSYVRCIASIFHDEYHVCILTPAGLSAIEFHPYREKKPAPNILQAVISKHLHDCHKLNGILYKPLISPDKIMAHMLGNKLDPKRELYLYLTDNFRGDPVIFTAFTFDNILLPNPFAFASSDFPWKERKIENFCCPCHGDMHGENLLLNKDGQYCLIDHSLYKPDGCLFYDCAYFEIAELLQTCGTDKPEIWLENMRQVARGQFDSLEFNGLAMIQAIRNAEYAWIKDVCSPQVSLNDSFLQARRLARVIAGLNFTGKRGMKGEQRLRAFLYAAANLEAMLVDWDISGWRGTSSKWEPGQEEYARKVAATLAEDAGNFERGPAFILFCGPQTEYGEALGHCLARIPWHSVFSFFPNPDDNHLFNALRDVTMVNSFYPGCEAGDLSAPSWIFAAGQAGHPEKVANTFGEWNRKCHRFVENMLDKCASATKWSEPLIILDADSLDPKYVQEIIRLCHSSDFLSLAILGEKWKQEADLEDTWKPMEIVHYPIGIMDLGAWCRINLEPRVKNLVIVPNASERSGVVLAQKDVAAIESYGKLVHNNLLCTTKEEDLYSFYYGHPISWKVLDKGSYVARDRRVDALINKLENCDGRGVPIIEFPHLPGAGASMICKAACWQLRHKYPVLELYRLEGNLEDALLRLSTHCGLPLLLLADNNFSSSDITSLATRLRRRHISALILHPRRVYSSKTVGIDRDDEAASEILSYLERQEVEGFFNAYSQRVRQENYSLDEKRRREKNLYRLAYERELEDLRLPFFFGMFAYEKDFVSLDDFIINIIAHLKENDGMHKLVQSLALITQYLSAGGLNIFVGTKLANITKARRLSAPKILKFLHEICGAPIICSVKNNGTTVLRLAHPLLAERILECCRGKDAASKAAFYRNFLHTLDSLGDGIPSKEFEDLAQALFLERDWEGKRLKFSPLIEDIGDYTAQKEVFETLIEIFDKNAHFHQHFGRLISNHDIRDATSALEHFDRALEIEPENMVHWHAKGNFYLRCVINEIKEIYSVADIYNRCADFVESAMYNFDMALEKASVTKEAAMDAEYPANSIIRLATLVVGKIKETVGAEAFKGWLLHPKTPEMKWAVELLEKAERFALEAETWAGTHSNDYGDNVRENLARICFSVEELERMIGNSRTDFVLKLAWMNSVKPESAPPERLQKMIEWGEDLIRQGKARSGLVWLWFKAVILRGRDNSCTLRSLVQLAENEETSLICTYIQGCLDFAAFMKGSAATVNEFLRKMDIVRKKWKDNKYIQKQILYYNPTNSIGLALTSENAPEVACKVAEEVRENQTGWLYLEQNARVKLFFAPVHFGCNIGQSLGKDISCRIAISYDGLRAVKPDQKTGSREKDSQ